MLSIKHPLVSGAAVVALVGAAGVAQAAGTHHGPGPDAADEVHAHGVLHGQFVRELRSGGTQHDFVQKGVVKDVTENGIKVRSKDGFTATYVINSSTRTDGEDSDNDRHGDSHGDAREDNNDDNGNVTIHRGDRVFVFAVGNEGVKIAKEIHDKTENEAQHEQNDD